MRKYGMANAGAAPFSPVKLMMGPVSRNIAIPITIPNSTAADIDCPVTLLAMDRCRAPFALEIIAVVPAPTLDTNNPKNQRK